MERDSYFQEYMRSKAMANASNSSHETKKLLTDRGAYISFLEIQLERVSAACLHTKSLEAQLHDVHVAVEAAEAKIATVTKLLKLHQQHSGEMVQNTSQDICAIQESIEALRDTATVQDTQLRRLDARLNEMDENVHSIETHNKVEMDSLRQRLDGAEERTQLHVDRYHTLFEAHNNKWTALHVSQQELTRNYGVLETKLIEHTDKQVAMLRDEACEHISLLDTRFIQMEDKIKRNRVSMEQYCNVEIARHTCTIESQFESLEQKQVVFDDQLARHQSRVQQLCQRHQEDCRLLNTTILSLQTDVEKMDMLASKGGQFPASEKRFVTLEKDYAICREGLEYLRKIMEQFEARQVELVHEWNAKMDYFTHELQNKASAKYEITTSREFHELVTRVSGLESTWDPHLLHTFVKSLTRSQK
ncbi:hypothetical protein THRCLA_11424 [Thraustotheca clavata]|uniref:Uncharacterized protein n=1 Tax=Thraustotheca clavata TaxID=74557 RepID=A0A1V9Y7R9_9STRA|nr:hypothetical protein THRCLA_11424 [Thraustotheca clavata]